MDDDFAGQPSPDRKVPWSSPILGSLAIMLLVLLLLPFFSTGRMHVNSRRAHCASNLRQIALALQAYENQYGCFPPADTTDAAGKPIQSWRTLILPFIDHQDLFDKYQDDEPWDGLTNRKLAETEIGLYRCPARLDHRPGLTDYVLIRGSGTAFPGDRRMSSRDVHDDPSTTLLLVERVDSGIHWAEPRDLEIGRMSFQIHDPTRPTLSSHHHGIVNVVRMDGSCRFLEKTMSPETLKAMITIDGHELIPKDD